MGSSPIGLKFKHIQIYVYNIPKKKFFCKIPRNKLKQTKPIFIYLSYKLRLY